MPRGPVLVTPTPTTAAPRETERRPAVAASTSVRPTRDVSPRSEARVDHRRLGNNANRVSPAGQTRDVQARRRHNRRRRSHLRHQVRGLTSLPRLRDCGAKTVTGFGGPILRISGAAGERVAGYAGLVTCGSVWACPVCAAKISARRAEELSHVMRHVLTAGGSASLITLTMRHHVGHRLKDLWGALSSAWRGAISGKQWIADQELGGLLGWVRVVEATYGRNGWHLHVHALVCWDRSVPLELAQDIGHRMWQRWSRVLERKGFTSLKHRGGVDVRMATFNTDNFAHYFTKLAREITSSHTKEARGGRSPFKILTDGLATGDADDLDLWGEWEQVSYGKRQLTWSLGVHDLRKLVDLAEQSDEEIADEDLAGEDLIALTHPTWEALLRGELTTDLLDAAEIAGVEGARAFLAIRDLEWIGVVA
jgi:Replication protein